MHPDTESWFAKELRHQLSLDSGTDTTGAYIWTLDSGAKLVTSLLGDSLSSSSSIVGAIKTEIERRAKKWDPSTVGALAPRASLEEAFPALTCPQTGVFPKQPQPQASECVGADGASGAPLWPEAR